MLASRLETLIDERTLQDQDPENRYITSGISWQHYETLLDKLGDNAGVRVTYCDGVLEIVSPSRRHESGKTRIGTLLEIYFLETETDYFPMGSTTLRSQATLSGAEPDESYCIGEEKALPDLVVEVVATSGGVNKLAVYGRLGISEAWFWQDNQLFLYRLREQTPLQFKQTHGYEPIARSELLPALDIALLTECIQQPNPLAAAKQFRSRLREQYNRGKQAEVDHGLMDDSKRHEQP
jgi:Uma2 family endonuclease